MNFKRKNKIPFGKPLINKKEIISVKQVFMSGIYAHGPTLTNLKKFSDFNDLPFVLFIFLYSRYALAYFSMGIGKGDEVIVLPKLHTATAHAVELSGQTNIC